MTLFQENLFVLDTPIFYWEVIKWLTAYQLHGSFTLAWFSRNRPHCLRRITAIRPLQRSDVRLDGSIIVPTSDHGRYREPPGTDSRLFLAPCQTEQAKDLHTFFSVVSCCSCLADSRAAAVRALAFAKEAGMCLMNGYAVFKVRLRGHKKTSHPFCRWVRGLHNIIPKVFSVF